MSSLPFSWEIYIESPNGNSSGTISSSFDTNIYPVRWQWEAKFDVLAASLRIEFADAEQYFAKWDNSNPLTAGSIVTMSLDGVQRFSGVIDEMSPHRSADDKTLIVKAFDHAGSLDQAGMKEVNSTRIKYGLLNLFPTEVDSITYLSEDVGGEGTSPWAEEYVIPVWSGTITPSGAVDGDLIPFGEYVIVYELGGIVFRNPKVRTVGDITSGSPATDFSGSLVGRIAYYDADDTTMRISEILKRAFEYPQVSGGLGWTDGVDFSFLDTPTDRINRELYITDEADGYIADYISRLYDNPAIGLAPSYQIHDYDGSGVVEGRLITQNSGSGVAKDVEALFDADFPTSLKEMFARAVFVNNEPTRSNIAFEKLLAITTFKPNPAYTETGDKLNTIDSSPFTAWGLWINGNFALRAELPEDVVIITYQFTEVVPVDTIAFNARWILPEEGENVLDDIGTFPGLKKIYQMPIYTIEWSTDGSNWFPIHPNLFYFSVDITSGEGSWRIVEDIGIETEHIRIVVNSPLWAKSGESRFGKADRVAAFYVTELKVYERGRVVVLDTDKQPEISFESSGADPLLDLAGAEVEMNRPLLVEKLSKVSLPKKTIVIEADNAYDFSGSGSFISKILATELDYHSKTNDWDIDIKPQANLYLGDTVFFSRLSRRAFWTMKGFVMGFDGEQIGHLIYMSDYESNTGGE